MVAGFGVLIFCIKNAGVYIQPGLLLINPDL